MAEDLVGGAHLDDGAAAQDDRLLADVVAEREVVGDEENAHAPGLEVGQQVQDVDPGGGVEHADDLVRHEDLEIQQQRAGHQEALQLSAAQLVRVLVQHLAGFERYAAERRLQLARSTPSRHLREVLAADQGEDAVGFEDRVVRAERILEYALDVAVVRLDGRRRAAGRRPRRRA